MTILSSEPLARYAPLLDQRMHMTTPVGEV